MLPGELKRLKGLPAMLEILGLILSPEDLLEKKIRPLPKYSCLEESPQTERPGTPQSMGLQEV